MQNSELLIGTSLLMLTGADILSNEGLLEIISKLGVVAVLWMWLKDMKKQLKEQQEERKAEISELRTHYQSIFDDLKDQQQNHQSNIERILINSLQKDERE